MQDGPADQAELADFIARGNKPDLVALLRHAGERLPSGSDTTADHRVVLLQYLRRAPGHLILALESLRAGDDVAEGAVYGDFPKKSRIAIKAPAPSSQPTLTIRILVQLYM